MTTYKLEITSLTGTYDITDRVLLASWSRSLGESSASLDITCKDILETHCMSAITLEVDGALCFSGTIKTQSESYNDNLKLTQFKCVDDTDRLQRIVVTEAFQNQSVKQIITALRNKYAPWLDVSRVQDVGGAIEQIGFNYETFAGVIEKCAEITGAYWNLSAGNVLSFFSEVDSLASFDFTGDKILNNTFDVESNAIDLCNRIWVIGAKQASSSVIEQNFTGDGTNQIYSIAYVPNYPEVWENDVPKTIELDDGDTPDSDYIYNKKEKVLKRVAGNLPPFTVLRLRYNPTVQVIDYLEDTDSVNKYGLYEKSVVDQKITDKTAARNRARAELKRVKKIIRYAKWNTRNWQISVGQVAKVDLPIFSVNSYWRITAIDVEFTPEDVVASISAEEAEY